MFWWAGGRRDEEMMVEDGEGLTPTDRVDRPFIVFYHFFLTLHVTTMTVAPLPCWPSPSFNGHSVLPSIVYPAWDFQITLVWFRGHNVAMTLFYTNSLGSHQISVSQSTFEIWWNGRQIMRNRMRLFLYLVQSMTQRVKAVPKGGFTWYEHDVPN